jgi:antitoxin (DNA-binding transcriptional repressor) of toxin-antitoxin stability system
MRSGTKPVTNSSSVAEGLPYENREYPRGQNQVQPLHQGAPKSGSVLITKNGWPCAALVPVTQDTDLEVLALSQNKRFWKLIDTAIERGKKEGLTDRSGKSVKGDRAASANSRRGEESSIQAGRPADGVRPHDAR